MRRRSAGSATHWSSPAESFALACQGHLRERRVGDPVPERQTAARVPPDLVREPGDVAPELEAEPRLADAGRARDADEPRDPAVDGRVEEVLEQAQLGVAPDQWGVEARDPLRPGDTGDRA